MPSEIIMALNGRWLVPNGYALLNGYVLSAAIRESDSVSCPNLPKLFAASLSDG